ncbi:EF-hand protein (macronuclear) [Tetrahymena thermophila SB210]|uniref:EF-hand protein n=1 Tax=Tetrahymena thermophila (strain SB210) TaxID=312017 RepID=W7XGM5_TETTS|nr:EF-hand protein [Tetrahymena thermophila SB210]EWS73301.1 EF-hand protein [Tetrahymena thermophila SB210]|eukprot:XP_012654150.1 EF-hand protein [Tetrahymena thermophila SB210]
MSSIKEILKDKNKLKKITEAAFKAVDIDSSGYLEKVELEKVMINVAIDIGVEIPSKEEVEEVLKELDEDGDGKLSQEEFQVLIVQVLEMMANADVQ